MDAWMKDAYDVMHVALPAYASACSPSSTRNLKPCPGKQAPFPPLPPFLNSASQQCFAFN